MTPKIVTCEACHGIGTIYNPQDGIELVCDMCDGAGQYEVEPFGALADDPESDHNKSLNTPQFSEETIRRARRKLFGWQPKATDIRADVCHCRNKACMLSYRLPTGEQPDKDGKESCGYYCATCGFGNAGWRVKENG